MVIPKLFCTKELYHTAMKCNVIKLALLGKPGKKQENKIPIKNNSNIPVTLELDFFKQKLNSDEVLLDNNLECYCYPTVLTVPANGMALIGILIK